MPAKKKPQTSYTILNKICENEIVTDLLNLKWKIGRQIATGGFGAIYLVKPQQNQHTNMEYVIKIEPFSNGPLFTEMHFYQRCCKKDMIESWITSNTSGKGISLAIPYYIASGSHSIGTTKFRFLIMERFGSDLEQIFSKNLLSESALRKLVCQIAIRMLFALEYIHDNGYVHSDIKASNIVPGISRSHKNQLFLLDYGLVSKYKTDKAHKAFRLDDRKAHDGTLEFTSIDAHNGTEPSRRSDLEILGYNLLKWTVGTLPWEKKGYSADTVKKEKIRFMKNIPLFMKTTFENRSTPAEIQSYFHHVSLLKYDETPKYSKLRETIFNATLKDVFKCPYKDNFFDIPLTTSKEAECSGSDHYHICSTIGVPNRVLPIPRGVPQPGTSTDEGPDRKRKKIKSEDRSQSELGDKVANSKPSSLRPRRILKLKPTLAVSPKISRVGWDNDAIEKSKGKMTRTKTPAKSKGNLRKLNQNGRHSPKNALLCATSNNMNQTCYLTPPETFDERRDNGKCRNSLSSIFSDDDE